MPEAIIALNEVSRTYQLGDDTIHALNKIKIEVKAGEFLAITGPSGSGKSTLANIIGGLDVTDEGTG